MQRTIDTDLHPYQRAKNLLQTQSFQVITPTRPVAITLGVERCTLKRLAQSQLSRQGWHTAPLLAIQHTLQVAVKQVLSPLDIAGTARAWTPALISILSSGISSEQLRATGCDRLQQLAELLTVYQTKLRQSHGLDLSEILWKASQLASDPRTILVYGYFLPSIAVLVYINAIAGEGSILFLPCREHQWCSPNQWALGWLLKQGWQLNSLQTPAETIGEYAIETLLGGHHPSAGMTAHTYADLETEVRGVITQVKHLLSQGVTANEIVLVTQDEALYEPTLLDIAWECLVPIRALYDIPLSCTRFGAWLRLLFATLLSNFSFEVTAKFLNHPLSLSISSEGDLTSYPSSGQECLDQGWNRVILESPEQGSLQEWVQWLRSVLSDCQLRHHTANWAREISALSTFVEELKGLASLEPEPLDLKTFAQEVMALMDLLGVLAQPGRAGVELRKPSSLIGAQYRYVFILGAVERVLSAPVRDRPILDFYNRKQLDPEGFKLPSAATAARLEALSVAFLLTVATEWLTLSYPRMMWAKEALPSPFLADLGLNPQPPTALPIASVESARCLYLRHPEDYTDADFPHAVRAWTIERRRESAEPWDEYDGVIGFPLDPQDWTFSASQLTRLGQCPFKWFVAHVLQLAFPFEPETDFSPGLKGSLYHKTLEIAMQQYGTRIVQPSGRSLLEAAFRQAEQLLKISHLPAWEAQRPSRNRV